MKGSNLVSDYQQEQMYILMNWVTISIDDGTKFLSTSN